MSLRTWWRRIMVFVTIPVFMLLCFSAGRADIAREHDALNGPRDSIFTDTLHGVPFTMVLVKGGNFLMGSPKTERNRYIDETQHRVTLDDYYIGQTEVSIAQYLTFVTATRSNHPEWLEEGNTYNIHSGVVDSSYYLLKGMSPDNGNYPVTGVSWRNALAFCEWLSDETGRDYRLPTEAEWEYAARGGQKSRGTLYSGSDDINEVAWYSGNSNNTTHPVAQLKPNELGLYDMTGNVWEWCLDYYGDYGKAPAVNPEGPASGTYRVDRGCAWSTFPERCRIAYRLDDGPDLRDFNLGFRIACSLKSGRE